MTTRKQKIRIKWLSDFCIIENFQFNNGEVYELPADWLEWAATQAEAKRLEILAPEELKTDVQIKE
jgi:hypothetical protein